MPPLSVLDLSFVTSGTPPSAALRNSLDLARHADALGYTRYWLAEHHNLPSVASPAPEIMIGQIAAATKRIRDRLRRRDAAEPRAARRRRALQDARGAVPGPHRPRPRPRARHRPAHRLRAQASAGAARRRRFPRAPAGADLLGPRFPRGPPLPADRGDALRRAAAADLAARFERLWRPARGADRRRLRLRAPLRLGRRGRGHAAVPRRLQPRRLPGASLTRSSPSRWSAPTPMPRPSASPRAWT